MVKKFLILFVIFLGFSANAKNIAFIDTDKIISDSVAMKSFADDIQQRKTSLERKFQDEESKLKDRESDLIKSSAMLSEDKRREKAVAFQQDVAEFKQNVQNEENKLKKDYMDAASKVLEKVKEIVANMNESNKEEEKFDLVLPTNSAIYLNDSMDITKDVVKKLNKEYKKIK